jgi:hypothetical protein
VEFTLTDTTGSQLIFDGQSGGLKALTDAAGNLTDVSYTMDGKPEEVQRSITVGGVTTTESYLYAYIETQGDNEGKLESVTLQRQVGSGSWTTVREVQYTYYGSSEDFGNLGDLKTNG